MKRLVPIAVLIAGAFAGVMLSRAQAPTPDAGQPKGGQAKAKQPRAMGVEDGWAVFQTRCIQCHDNPAMADRAPAVSLIRQMPPERILAALTDGPMKTQGSGMSEEERRRVAEFMSGRPLGASALGDAKNMPNHCTANPAMTDPAAGNGWNGWGADSSNTRFQPAKAAGLTAADVPKLKLKWAFGYPAGLMAHAQPAIVSGRVFVGTDTGFIYSLNAMTGCVYWSYETGALVRNAISVGPVKGHGSSKYAIYFGDAKANVFAIDAQNGELLWKKHVDDYIVARITAAPKLYDGKLFVPVSSSEEFQGGNMDYSCCTSRGSVVALDANTGEQAWKAYVVPEPKPTKKNSKGTQLYGPAGGSVWNSPTIDPVRHAVYFGTGDAETEPADKHTDAIMAVDINTGKELWTYQVSANDAFMGGCGGGPNGARSENCPSMNGPDDDIGNSPILRTLPGGKRVLIAGDKLGDVFALDPDSNGKQLWRVKASAPLTPAAPAAGGRGGGAGGIVWGGAADEQNVYYGFTGGGMAALALATGERKWFVPISAQGTRTAHSAAASVIPGVVFVGGADGSLNALATSDGHTLWQFDTAKDFETVNKVAAHGGSMRAAGPVVANGMLYVGSGYAVSGGDKTGNVLLAFSIQ